MKTTESGAEEHQTGVRIGVVLCPYMSSRIWHSPPLPYAIRSVLVLTDKKDHLQVPNQTDPGMYLRVDERKPTAHPQTPANCAFHQWYLPKSSLSIFGNVARNWSR